MADHGDIMNKITRKEGVKYPVLTPNLQGFKAAVRVGAWPPLTTDNFTHTILFIILVNRSLQELKR